jgi:hypothetical protein
VYAVQLDILAMVIRQVKRFAITGIVATNPVMSIYDGLPITAS